MNKLLFEQEKWIQKMAPVSEGAIDEELRGLFFGPAGPSGRERAARSEGSAVHSPVGDAVRSDALHGHGAVCPHQGVSVDANLDAEAWAAQPRHLQPRVPHARSAGLRAVVPALHEGVRQ